MKKYWAFCRVSVQNAFVYRGPMLIWLVSNLLSLVTIIAVWFSISGNEILGGYTKPELITYYVVALFLDWLTLWLPFYEITDQIQNGEIILTVLAKPISLYWQKFSQELGWHLVSLLVGLISTSIVAVFLRQYLFFQFSPVNLFLVLLTIILAIFIIYTLSLSLGLLSFWFTEVYAIDSLFWAARTILSGRVIPLSFIPAGLGQTVVKILPFRYMFSFPLEIYFNKLSVFEIFQGLVIQLFWLGILLFIYKITWSRGRRAYTSFGQ
ncbi:MAG TPA: ABC-2 family transporter protein [Candidatus Bathyarchaeia archaeon]|nr:ABC-2 family transporter protein [Candidatus Bathyarchaeia archaeon]